MKVGQIIRCGVESCVHNRPDHFCELASVKILPCRPFSCDSVRCAEASMCASFEHSKVEFL